MKVWQSISWWWFGPLLPFRPWKKVGSFESSFREFIIGEPRVLLRDRLFYI